jgi:type I restriction enzyme R subunit
VDNVAVSVANERVQYYGPDGKLITESLKDYTKTNIKKNFASLDDFILRWSSAEKKEELIKELAEQGILLEALREEVGKDMDAFDLVCHVAFDQPPLTRKERANNVRKRNYFAKYQGKAREVLDALLTKYENEGITTLESGSTLKVAPITNSARL